MDLLEADYNGVSGIYPPCSDKPALVLLREIGVLADENQ
jgi:hypothetical protein